MSSLAWRLDHLEEMRAYRREHYRKNKSRYIANHKARRNELRVWLRAYKASLGCRLCKEDNIACLDFHHLDPSVKEETIGAIFSRGWGKERIMNEVKKCVVLCANCHRKLHYGGVNGLSVSLQKKQRKFNSFRPCQHAANIKEE